jgi:hypothetical protein
LREMEVAGEQQARESKWNEEARRGGQYGHFIVVSTGTVQTLILLLIPPNKTTVSARTLYTRQLQSLDSGQSQHYPTRPSQPVPGV